MQQNRRGARDSAERDGFLEAFELIGSGKIALGAWLFQLVLICDLRVVFQVVLRALPSQVPTWP